MSQDCAMEGQLGEEEFGQEDDLDAFNDETFGGGGLGDEWKEDAHEELAMLTEQERQAMKQSQDFFNFGSDGEELGGELEDGLESQQGHQNGVSSHSSMVQRLDQLSLQQGGAPQATAPLTVQTSVPPQPQHLPPHNFQQQQQMMYPQMPPQQVPLLPPSHFAGGQPPAPVHYQDPAIMSLSKMPPGQPGQFMAGPGQQPGYMPPPPHGQFMPPGGQQRPAFSPPTVPGMKTLADIENEMMYGPPRPPQQQQPPMMMERGGHVGHINPALHNLNYPGMRDRQTQQQARHQQQPPAHQQQQYRQSPVMNNQQFPHQQRPNNQQQQQLNRQQQQQRGNNNYNQARRNDNYYNDNRREQFHERDHDNNQHQRRQRYNDINRRNEETFGAAAVRDQELKEFGDQSVTRRDLMPGHVHTLGILRHSRSRHDRHNHETFGEEMGMASNPTGDPLLDARMVEEEEEMARRRRHYANSEDEYAGLMSQKDKQWIINIQLNQLKCDNPYVDDYYFTMYQARKEEQKKEDNKAGNHLLLNESVVELPPSYTPAQFENSLGKLQCVTVKAPRQIIDVGVMRHDTGRGATDSPGADHASPAPGAVVVSDKKHAAGEYKQLLMKIEVLYTALLDLEADKLKLNALPTGAPLREQISNDEVSHLQILQSGLSNNEAISDCLAVAKGRNLVLRSLAYLTKSPLMVNNILNSIMANIHHVARNDKQDLQFWTILAKHIDTESLDKLEPAASNLLNLKNKLKRALLSTSLGSTIMLTLILKASLETGKSNNNMNTWSLLAQSLLTSVAEGVKLGAFLVQFNLAETTLANLLSLDNKLKPAWLNLMELSKGVEMAS